MLLAQLRKACNHPYLFKGAETSDQTDLAEMVEASGKLQVGLCPYVRSLLFIYLSINQKRASK